MARRPAPGAPGVQFHAEALTRVAARGPFIEARLVLKLNGLVALIEDDPWTLDVVLCDRVAVLAHRTDVRMGVNSGLGSEGRPSERLCFPSISEPATRAPASAKNKHSWPPGSLGRTLLSQR